MKPMALTMIFGIVLILFGLSLILKTFGIDFPLIKPFFAVVLIYMGIMMIIGNSQSTSYHASYSFHHEESSLNRSIVFSKQTLRLNTLANHEKPLTMTLNVVFGSGTIILDPTIPTTIKINSAFSNVQLPQDTMLVLGSHVFSNHGPDQQSHIIVNVNVVFGNLVVI